MTKEKLTTATIRESTKQDFNKEKFEISAKAGYAFTDDDFLNKLLQHWRKR